jgi:hypothetical protein
MESIIFSFSRPCGNAGKFQVARTSVRGFSFGQIKVQTLKPVLLDRTLAIIGVSFILVLGAAE